LSYLFILISCHNEINSKLEIAKKEAVEELIRELKVDKSILWFDSIKEKEFKIIVRNLLKIKDVKVEKDLLFKMGDSLNARKILKKIKSDIIKYETLDMIKKALRYYKSIEYQERLTLFKNNLSQEAYNRKVEEHLKKVKREGFSEERMRIIDTLVLESRGFVSMNRYRKKMLGLIISIQRQSLTKNELKKLNEEARNYFKARKKSLYKSQFKTILYKTRSLGVEELSKLMTKSKGIFSLTKYFMK